MSADTRIYTHVLGLNRWFPRDICRLIIGLFDRACIRMCMRAHGVIIPFDTKDEEMIVRFGITNMYQHVTERSCHVIVTCDRVELLKRFVNTMDLWKMQALAYTAFRHSATKCLELLMITDPQSITGSLHGCRDIATLEVIHRLHPEALRHDIYMVSPLCATAARLCNMDVLEWMHVHGCVHDAILSKVQLTMTNTSAIIWLLQKGYEPGPGFVFDVIWSDCDDVFYAFPDTYRRTVQYEYAAIHGARKIISRQPVSELYLQSGCLELVKIHALDGLPNNAFDIVASGHTIRTDAFEYLTTRGHFPIASTLACAIKYSCIENIRWLCQARTPSPDLELCMAKLMQNRERHYYERVRQVLIAHGYI